MPSLDIRQAQLPGCVVGCIGTTDLGSCSSLLDSECICRSTAYQEDLANCFIQTCSSASDAVIGQQFGAERCAAIGITITAQLPSATASITGPSLSETGLATPTSVDVTGTPSSWFEPPVLYTQTLVNVQAVMSSVCGALLLAAIILGIFSCRARIKKDRAQTASQWSGAGTFGDQTKFEAGASRFGISRPGQTDTFVSDYRQTLSFGAASNHLPYERPALGVGAGAGGGRFTNRTTVDEMEEEEWEMKDRIEPAPGPVSPSSSSSSRHGFTNRIQAQAQEQEEKDEHEDEDKKDAGNVEELPVPTPTTARSGINSLEDDDEDREVGQLHVLEKHHRPSHI